MRKYLGAGLVLLAWLGMGEPALADNCGSLSDCYGVAIAAAIAGVAIPILISLLLDFSPVGRLKGILEAIIGRDLFGNKLTWWERALGLIPGGRSAGRAAKAAKNLEKIDRGHSLARHGPNIADADLQKRLTHGIAPDGKFSPTSASTRFQNYDDWLQTRQAALNAIAKREGIDLSKAPPPGTHNKFEAIVDHGRPIDDGFIGTGAKVKIQDPATGKVGKGYTNTQPVNGLTRTKTAIEWNPTAGRWEVKQHYPDAQNWDQTTGTYTFISP